MTEHFDYAVVGLGRARLRDGVRAGEARALRHRPGAVRARAPPRRQPRHQPDPAAQLPHAGVRRPDRRGVRRLGAAGGGERRAAGDKVGGLDLFPPDAAIPLVDYAGSLDAIGIPHLLLDRAEIADRWPQFSLPDGTVALYQERGSIVPAGPGTALMLALADRHGAVLRDRSPVTGLVDRGDGGVEVRAGDAAYTCGAVVVCADAWTNQVLAHLGHEIPLTVTLEQATYFAPEDPEPVRAGPDAAVDLDGRAVVLRLPLLRRADGEGGAGLRRAGGRPGRARATTSDPAMEALLAGHMARMLPGSGRPVRSLRCQYTLPPGPRLRARPGARAPAVVVGLGRRARLQVRADPRPAAGRPGRRGTGRRSRRRSGWTGRGSPTRRTPRTGSSDRAPSGRRAVPWPASRGSGARRCRRRGGPGPAGPRAGWPPAR